MGDGPSETDKALLERLNALKPSSVQLERGKMPPEFSYPESSPVLDLSSRFASLSTSTPISTNDDRDVTEGTLKYEENGGNSQSSIPKDSCENREHIQNLVNHAKAALSLSKELEDSTKSVAENAAPSRDALQKSTFAMTGGRHKEIWRLDDSPSDSDGDENNGGTDDEQADEILQNIIDELEVEPESEPEPEPKSEPSKTEGSLALPTSNPGKRDKAPDAENKPADVPTATSSSPPPSSSTPKPPPESSSIQSLPDVPTFIPEPTEASTKSNMYSGSSWRNNNTVAHWCCICSDDATRKCFGCEGNSLYCVRCWNEAHLEDGYEEEREHQWVRWSVPSR